MENVLVNANNELILDNGQPMGLEMGHKIISGTINVDTSSNFIYIPNVSELPKEIYIMLMQEEQSKYIRCLYTIKDDNYAPDRCAWSQDYRSSYGGTTIAYKNLYKFQLSNNRLFIWTASATNYYNQFKGTYQYTLIY